MQEKQPMSEVIKETIDKVKSIADTKTVIGDPITLIEGVTILPVSRVSVGAALGGGEYGAKKDRRKEQTEKVVTDNFGGGGGAGVKIDPVAFLVIKDGTTRVMPVAVPPVSTVDRIVDMAPDIVDKIGKFFDKKDGDETV